MTGSFLGARCNGHGAFAGMTEMVVRAASPGDATGIVRIGRETWPITHAFAGSSFVTRGLASWWSEEAVLRGIETTHTFVAEVGGDVIGMGNIDRRAEQPIIWKLYVVPHYQGAGAGHALLERLLAEVPPGQDVLLEYTDGNVRAADFYHRHGFVDLRRDPPEKGGWPAQVWMVKRPHGSHRVSAPSADAATSMSRRRPIARSGWTDSTPGEQVAPQQETTDLSSR